MGPLQTLTADFHQKLGLALTRWQNVETSLFGLAHALMETRYEISSTVFFHTKSAEAKLQLVDKLCLACLPEDVLNDEWHKLKKAVSNHIIARNAMAHSEVLLVDKPPSKSGIPSLAIALRPHHLDAQSARKAASKTRYAADISRAAREYLECAQALMRFAVQHIPDWQQRVAQLPPSLRLALKAINDEKTSGELQPPPISSRA
jgi:hypothetical protein